MKSVSIAVTLKDSAKANNYNLTNGSVNATGTIAKASQTAPSISGLPTGTITYGDSFTLHTEGGVSWSASGAATVDSSGKVTVTGTGKVTITVTKPGDNNHYSAEDQITFTAVPKALTVTGLTAEDRAYDGTNAVQITGVILNGIVSNDNVSVNLANLTGTLNGSDVGTYTAVTLNWLEGRPFTTAFVTGNHENYDALRKYPLEEWRSGSIRRIRPSVILLERGQIFSLGGKRFFTMGGASSHDIQDGILELDDPLFKKKCRELGARGAMYRVNHLSWWKEELPSEDEYQTARANLDRAGWEVDYIITHCCSTSVQDELSGGFYQADTLTDFLDEV